MVTVHIIGTWDASSKTCTLTADIQASSDTGAIKLNQAIWQSGFSGSGTTESITINGDWYTKLQVLVEEI